MTELFRSDTKKKIRMRFQGILALCVPALLSACIVTHGQPMSGGRTPAGYFHIETWASTDCAKPGETVTVRATVINDDTRTQIVQLEDRPVFDMEVRVIDKEIKTYRWSQDKPLSSDLTLLDLGPGQSKTIEMQWVVQPQTSVLFSYALFIPDSSRVNDPVRAPAPTINVSLCGPY